MSDEKNKQNILNQIEADIIKHNVCPNLAQTAKQLVMGAGNLDADIVFIGEAPGAKEDESGVPFVGASGKLLDEMLETIGLGRDDIYITNIVKYRPPNNRDPSEDEKLAFMPYLIRQLEVIQPKLVVPLGRHSMNVFLPDAVISEAHGKTFLLDLNQITKGFSESGVRGEDKNRTEVYEKYSEGESQSSTKQPNSITLLPLYHPAAAIYNRKLRETVFSDFKRIPNI